MHINPYEFGAWLLDSSSEIFYRSSKVDCPLGVYLRKTIDSRARVCPTTILLEGYRFTSPKWIQKFVSLVDNSKPKTITGHQAEKYLRKALSLHK